MNIDPKLIDYFPDEHDGYPPEMEAEDSSDTFRDAAGEAAREFPSHLWIEPREWKAVAEENDRWGTWPIDYVDRFTNQQPTHECTCHSLTRLAEGCWNRQRRAQIGPPEPEEFKPISRNLGGVWLSCVSVYSEANPRQWGGASTRGVMEIAVRRGFLPDKIQPREYGFKHELVGTCGKGNVTQSSGRWVALRNFPDGWQSTARHFCPLEIIIPESWEQAVCLVLHGYGVGVGRSGHAVPWMRMVWEGNSWNMQYPDSYDLFRYDSERTVRRAGRSGYSIASFTTPDDWEKPAG